MRSTINKYDVPIAVIDGQLNISESRKLGFLTDVTINASNMKQYPAHKLILSIASDYFKALFTGRFTQVTEVNLTEFEAQTVELYLDMIYGVRIVFYDWRELMKLLLLAKFTQTVVRGQNNIIKSLLVDSREFVEYVQTLSLLYDNGLPSDIIALINLPLLPPPDDDITETELALYLCNVKLSELGEEFVASFIESRQDDTTKYIIAQKAVLEGMSKNLYKLVRKEKVTARYITPEALPYLRTVDPTLLSSYHDIALGLPFTVTIGDYQFKNINGRDHFVFLGTTSDPFDVQLAVRTRYPRKDFNTDAMNVFSKDGTARNLSEFANSPLIRVTKFQQVRDYFVIDDYELLDD